MTEITVTETQAAANDDTQPTGVECPECIGSGGWFRYEPALEAPAGMLSLSCLQCRGSGRMAPAVA